MLSIFTSAKPQKLIDKRLTAHGSGASGTSSYVLTYFKYSRDESLLSILFEYHKKNNDLSLQGLDSELKGETPKEINQLHGSHPCCHYADQSSVYPNFTFADRN